MGQTLPPVALLLLDPVALDGRRMGGAILPPVARMIGAPILRAVEAALTIHCISHELVLAALAAALLLTGLIRTDGLLRVKSGRFKLPLAETTTPQSHPLKISAIAVTAEADQADCFCNRDPQNVPSLECAPA
jgi:hypothetical protein